MENSNLIYIIILAVAVSAVGVTLLTVWERVSEVERTIAPNEYAELCTSVCNEVATDWVCQDENATDAPCYNYTEPHDSMITGSKYCTCFFQGQSRTFTFDAQLKKAFDEAQE